jgi:hypothetical protein
MLLVGSAANAAELLLNDTGQLWIASPDGSVGTICITQNNDTSTIETGSVSCGVAGSHTADNQYLRLFELGADHGLVDDFTVKSVDWAVQQHETPTGELVCSIVTTNLYSIAIGDPFVYANLTLVSTADTEVCTDMEGTFVNVLMDGLFDANTQNLVMELTSPDLSAEVIQFRPGSNTGGVIADAYIASLTCGIDEPTPVTAIGFPDSQYVYIVNGETGDDPPTPTEDATWSEVKSLF